MSRIRSAALGYVALNESIVQPESDAKLSHTTGGLWMPFSIAAAILGINDSDNPERAAVAPQNFQKVPSLIP